MSLLSRKNAFAFVGALAVVGFAGVTAPRADAVTFVYYDFNNATTTATLTTASVGSSLSTMTNNFTTPASNVTHFNGTTNNAFNGATAGEALALVAGTSQVNNGKYLQFTANTTGYKNIQVSYSTQKTATGFNSDQFQYSLDGTTFVNFGTPYNPPTSFATTSFDLSSIVGLNNDSAAAFRIVFSGATGSSGNNRIDNLQIVGAVPEVSTSVAMLAGGLGLGVLLMSKRRKLQTFA